MSIRKSIIKLLKIGIMSILVISSTMTSANDNEKKILTLEKAIEGGINMEDKGSVFSKQIVAYNEQLKMIQNISDVQYYSTKYSRDEAEQQKKLIKDVVEYNVTVLYDTIIMLQKQIHLDKINIDLKQKELKQVEIKSKNGQLSQIDLSLKKNELDKAKSQQIQDELTLENYKTQFLNLTNINIDNYDGLEENLKYEALEYTNGVGGLITKNVDYYMKNAENFLAYKKDNIIGLAQAQTITGPSLDVVYNIEAQVAESEYNIEQKKKSMIEGLRNCATELEKLQEKFKIESDSITSEKIKADAIRIKYEKGYISELEMKQVEQSILTLEMAYEQDIYTYKHQKMILEKPWVKY